MPSCWPRRNPFERLSRLRRRRGAQSALQDIGLTFHPPTLYLGYVGLSVAFSFAVGALLTRQVTRISPKSCAVVARGVDILTLGITAGSYWAYYELGWGCGGSGTGRERHLMPWARGDRAAASASVLETRDALRTWTICSGWCVSMSMLAPSSCVRAFLPASTRRGRPERGRSSSRCWRCTSAGPWRCSCPRRDGERRGALRAGEPGRSAGGSTTSRCRDPGVVCWAALSVYPLLTEAFDVRVSVGPPYFNPVGAIFFLPMWRCSLSDPCCAGGATASRGSAGRCWRSVLFVATLGGIWLLPGSACCRCWNGDRPALGVASLLPLRRRSLRRLPLAVWGMVLGHLGARSRCRDGCRQCLHHREARRRAHRETADVGAVERQLEAVDPVAGPLDALEARLSARYAGGAEHTLAPSAQLLDPRRRRPANPRC